MIKYEDAIWQLALSKAHSYYGGDSMPQAEGAHTVAWIFEVTESQVSQDINKVYAAACHKAFHG
jgi:hypothetical protein